MGNLHFSEKEKKLFLFVIFLLVIYGGYSGVYMRFSRQSGLLDKKTMAATKKLNKNLWHIAKAKNFERRYNDILDSFKQNKSDEKEMSLILTELQDVAGKIEVRIADMKPRKVRKVDFYNLFAVSLSIEGSMTDVMQYIYLLQNPPHSLRVNEFSISKKSVRSNILRCKVELSRLLIP